MLLDIILNNLGKTEHKLTYEGKTFEIKKVGDNVLVRRMEGKTEVDSMLLTKKDIKICKKS
jgi:hypothetical protein